jgi:hypothetical protein
MQLSYRLLILCAGLVHTAVPLVWCYLQPNALMPTSLWWALSAISGVAIAFTALAPQRYWPVWLCIGLQKLVCLGWCAAQGLNISTAFGTYELLWLGLLGLMIRRQYMQFVAPITNIYAPDWRVLANTTVPYMRGYTLGQKQQKTPQLVVLLRHSGCTFCRQTIDELSAVVAHRYIPPECITVVTQSDEAAIARWQQQYPLLEQIDWVSDPQRQFYAAFMLKRGRWAQLFGAKVWWRGFKALRYGVGALEGDGFQMPGVVLLHQYGLIAQQPFVSAADRVDWPGWQQSIAPILQPHAIPQDKRAYSY